MNPAKEWVNPQDIFPSLSDQQGTVPQNRQRMTKARRMAIADSIRAGFGFKQNG